MQQLTGETFNNLVNVTNEARLDISARGFWVTSQMAFFDIRVFNPIAKRYATLDLAKSYQVNENEKKKKYNDRVLQVEHGSFTPLVMSAAGGMSRECKHFYRRLSEIIAEKRKQDYSVITTWIRRKVSFSLIKSIGMCIRVSRSLFCPNLEASISCDAKTSELTSRM